MQAEVISIGDELLIGKTINTNAAWIGSELSNISIVVKWSQTISDNREAIRQAFDTAFERSNLIIVTGGLGPTKDDITKHVLCEYFNTELEINSEVLARIEGFFVKRKRPMLEVNIQQAALPKSCVVIHNYQGTACGMWFEKNGKVLVSLPGVPYEMQGMMKGELLARFSTYFKVKSLYHKTILTTGIGESFLAETMKDWEKRILDRGFGLAFLPSPGQVKLRITSNTGMKDKTEIDTFFEELKQTLPQHVFGQEDESLTGVTGDLLRRASKQLGTVESCTGGGLASEIISVPGASDYFRGSIVSYHEQVKTDLAHVPSETSSRFGVVSQETAEAMALGGKKQLKVDYCLATTGVAGPNDDGEIIAGTIWIALATPTGVISKKYTFGDNRERNIQMAIYAALNLLRMELLAL